MSQFGRNLGLRGQKRGAVIRAAELRESAKLAEGLARSAVGSGARRQLSIDGIALSLLRRALGISLEVVKTKTGGLTARSGTTPGTGTVTVQGWTGSAFTDLGDETCRNLSATAFTTAGKYGFAVRLWGTLFLISLEC